MSLDLTNSLWIIGPLLGCVVWFIQDKHGRIMAGVELAATKTELDELKEKLQNEQNAAMKRIEDAKAEWRADLRLQNEQHQRERARLEAQNKEGLSAIVLQFQERMGSMEKGLADKIDMVLHIVERRNHT